MIGKLERFSCLSSPDFSRVSFPSLAFACQRKPRFLRAPPLLPSISPVPRPCGQSTRRQSEAPCAAIEPSSARPHPVRIPNTALLLLPPHRPTPARGQLAPKDQGPPPQPHQTAAPT